MAVFKDDKTNVATISLQELHHMLGYRECSVQDSANDEWCAADSFVLEDQWALGLNARQVSVVTTILANLNTINAAMRQADAAFHETFGHKYCEPDADEDTIEVDTSKLH